MRSPILSKSAAAAPTAAPNSLIAFLIFLAIALSGCKKNRSDAALEILPDPQAESRTRNLAGSPYGDDTAPHPQDTAASPTRDDLTRDDSTALEFVSNVYRNYATGDRFSALGRDADTLFSPELLALIREDSKQAQGEVGYLDGDPLCDCQDFDITDVRISLRNPHPPG